MKYKAAKTIILLGMIYVLAMGYFLFVGPRMKNQPHLRAYDAKMPHLPAGAVPVKDARLPLPTTQQAASLRNPLPATPDNIQRGRTYYQYYCIFCHGQTGDGYGPVGESFFPTPTDLRGAKVKALSDGQLLRAMLTGTGHEPVLETTVLSEHRWYLVLYVRSLAAENVHEK